MFNKGFIFRWGMRIKDCGERIGHVNIFGIPILGWLADPIISVGLKIKDSVLSYPLIDIAV